MCIRSHTFSEFYGGGCALCEYEREREREKRKGTWWSKNPSIPLTLISSFLFSFSRNRICRHTYITFVICLSQEKKSLLRQCLLFSLPKDQKFEKNNWNTASAGFTASTGVVNLRREKIYMISLYIFLYPSEPAFPFFFNFRCFCSLLELNGGKACAVWLWIVLQEHINKTGMYDVTRKKGG